MKRIEIRTVVLVDETQARYVEAVEEGVDPIEQMETEVRLAVLETGDGEGEDLHLAAEIETFEMTVTDVEVDPADAPAADETMLDAMAEAWLGNPKTERDTLEGNS